ncbi:MAG: hypothetical protein IJ150_10285 [Bacteroidales bacterium]|nr:hypothetical protein [Bacteroidales bacterium]
MRRMLFCLLTVQHSLFHSIKFDLVERIKKMETNSILVNIGGILALIALLYVVFTKNSKRTLIVFAVLWGVSLFSYLILNIWDLGNFVFYFILPLSFVSWFWLFFRHTWKLCLALFSVLFFVVSLSPNNEQRYRSKGIEW